MLWKINKIRYNVITSESNHVVELRKLCLFVIIFSREFKDQNSLTNIFISYYFDTWIRILGT